MINFILLFTVVQLFTVINARALPDVDFFDPFVGDAEFPDDFKKTFDPFGAIDDTFDPMFGEDPFEDSLYKPEFSFESEVEKDFQKDLKMLFRSSIILPQFISSNHFSGPEYRDSSSSFDIFNDLVYEPDFLFNNPAFLPKTFPVAEVVSVDLDPDFAQSLEDIESYFGDEHRNLYEYFGDIGDSNGDAGEFGGSLASFFSQIYDGPTFSEDES